MKLNINSNKFEHGFSIEIICQTPQETEILSSLWDAGKITRGDGESFTEDGYNTGFYIDFPKTDKTPSQSPIIKPEGNTK